MSKYKTILNPSSLNGEIAVIKECPHCKGCGYRIWESNSDYDCNYCQGRGRVWRSESCTMPLYNRDERNVSLY